MRITGLNGLQRIDGRLAFVAAAPILTTEREGPPRGTLIWGRYVEEQFFNEISESIELEVSHSFPSDDLPLNRFERIITTHHGSFTMPLEPQSESEMNGYALLHDMYGTPAFIIKLRLARDITQQGRLTIGYFTASLIGFSALFGLRAYPNKRYTEGMKNTETKATKRARGRTPNHPTTTDIRISDELWALLAAVLPVHEHRHRFGGGRPRVPDRRCADVIFYV
jgi:hypothetical protein